MDKAGYPFLRVVAIVIIVVATIGVRVVAGDEDRGVGIEKMDFIGKHVLAGLVVEVVAWVVVGDGLPECNGEATRFGKECGIVHLSLE